MTGRDGALANEGLGRDVGSLRRVLPVDCDHRPPPVVRPSTSKVLTVVAAAKHFRFRSPSAALLRVLVPQRFLRPDDPAVSRLRRRKWRKADDVIAQLGRLRARVRHKDRDFQRRTNKGTVCAIRGVCSGITFRVRFTTGPYCPRLLCGRHDRSHYGPCPSVCPSRTGLIARKRNNSEKKRLA